MTSNKNGQLQPCDLIISPSYSLEEGYKDFESVCLVVSNNDESDTVIVLTHNGDIQERNHRIVLWTHYGYTVLKINRT